MYSSLDMKAMSQMLNFGKSVSDNGWGMFTGFLKYKLEEQGKKLVKVDKFFASSQICSDCGYRNAETRKLAVREWDCPQCETHHDRDVNAYVRKNAGLQTADIWYNKEDFVKEIIEQRNKNPERV